MGPLVVILYVLGTLSVAILFLYFIKMAINTSDTFLDFIKKNVDYIKRMKFYYDLRANAIIASIFLVFLTQDIAIPISAFFFVLFSYKTIMILSTKNLKFEENTKDNND